ncbi:Mediator of RNA polymerase II transcription subunit 18 [Tolypocladium ophioglossoides CBS 100239]|uniref:Mediator of RNA polymerase II transcription subunit 18 n=1 Tax=Tolypocladium ophioglossoides (strain CBS 100239) TaxID=1163406 RepID=A0A0L0N4N2_TOLOC|nr:Mediator of RNA polymerase II transcription subunit 18 [Tolypocladium ophioglossoides CBS 100239]
MYELFLTALVEGSDFHAACAVLSGFCAMPPWETVNRVLYFQGPPRPTGISNQASVEKPMRKDAAFLWKDLHQNLSRQSFVLQARYDVVKERDMGPSAAPVDLDSAQGILRWTDFPDPPHGRPVLTQRKAIELWEQRKLPSVLRDNHYQFKTETIEEVYRFFRDQIEFCLTRQYFLKAIHDYTPLESRQHQPPEPLSTLPAWDSLTPVDMQNRWILQVKIHVLQDNKPDEIRKAQDQLASICGELEGSFDFKTIDRKVHDTRVAMQQQGIQALPQKVMLGKN